MIAFHSLIAGRASFTRTLSLAANFLSPTVVSFFAIIYLFFLLTFQTSLMISFCLHRAVTSPLSSSTTLLLSFVSLHSDFHYSSFCPFLLNFPQLPPPTSPSFPLSILPSTPTYTASPFFFHPLRLPALLTPFLLLLLLFHACYQAVPFT